MTFYAIVENPQDAEAQWRSIYIIWEECLRTDRECIEAVKSLQLLRAKMFASLACKLREQFCEMLQSFFQKWPPGDGAVGTQCQIGFYLPD